MNTLIVAFAALLAVANAGVLVGHAAHGIALQGPGSDVIVAGPDGSVIRSLEQGGAVLANGHSGAVVHAGLGYGYAAYGAAPIVAAPLAYASPLAYGYGIAGDGHEGQYVPSGLENLYDDGSYRGEHGLYY